MWAKHLEHLADRKVREGLLFLALLFPSCYYTRWDELRSESSVSGFIQLSARLGRRQI